MLALLCAVLCTAQSEDTSTASGIHVLVVYFSRAGENYNVGVVEKGSTQIVAEMLAETLSADLFRIQTVNAYPESYEECKTVTKQEKNDQARPELSDLPDNLDDYDVIYLVYPIWWSDMPMAIYTFLESYDFTVKTIIPFCTHAGSSLASTVISIQAICSGATVADGFAILGTEVQEDEEKVKAKVAELVGNTVPEQD